jgi:ribonuclease P protein component
MKKRLRLRRAKDFERLRQAGRVYRHPLLMISLAPNGLPHNRYGFIITRRLGNAVARNRVRRLLREILRRMHPQLRQGYDAVIIARPEATGQPMPVIQQSISEVLRSAAMLLDQDKPTK